MEARPQQRNGLGLRLNLTMSQDHENTAPDPQPYAEEVLCANWIPLALTLAEPLVRTTRQSVLDATDAESLLARLYLCQQA